MYIYLPVYTIPWCNGMHSDYFMLCIYLVVIKRKELANRMQGKTFRLNKLLVLIKFRLNKFMFSEYSTQGEMTLGAAR